MRQQVISKFYLCNLKYLAFILLILLSPQKSRAQSLTLQWAHSYGSTIQDNASAIVTDGMGNVYVSGQFGGTIDFDPGPGVYNFSSTSGGYDIYLSKFDPNGIFLWAIQIEGPGAGTDALAVDISGNVYLSGAGNGISFISKISPGGSIIWTTQFLNINRARIDTDVTGNLYVTGTFSGVTDFDPGPNSYNLTSPAQSVFLLKLSTNANFIWAFQIDCSGSNPNPGRSIVVGQSGDIYISGSLNQAADFDPGNGVFTVGTSGQSIFIARYNSSGSLVWAKSVGNDIYNYGIAKDNNENIFLTGNFLNTIDFDPGPGLFNLSSGPTGRNTYVLKLDNSGNFIWAKHIAAITGNWAYSIASDNIGNIYVTGIFGGPSDFDPGAGTYNLITVGGASVDTYIWKLDNTGNFVFAVPFGSINYDVGQAITLDPTRNILLSGIFGGTMDCDPGPAIYNLNMLDLGDAFFLKLSQCANVTYFTMNITSCSAYTLNNQMYTSSGTYTQVLQNTAGCDSILTLNLAISGSNDTSAVTACNSYIWNNQAYTTSGFYRDTLSNSLGCDSIVNLDLIINYSVASTIAVTICEGDNYEGYGTSGSYVNTFTAVNNCDSIRTLNLTVKPKASSALNATICEGENFWGYTETGSYNDTLISANGCDSIRIINLLVRPRTFSNLNVQICSGQTYFAAGVNQTISGLYRDTLRNSLGCDSIIITNLVVNPKPTPTLGPDIDLCLGSVKTFTPGIFASYIWQNQSTLSYFTTTNTGLFWVEVTDNNNCKGSDTVRIRSILPIPENFLIATDTICQYDKLIIQPSSSYQAYFWSNGSNQSSITVGNPGLYILEVTDFNNCKGKDSVQIIGKSCHTGVFFPTGFSPNGDYVNDIFRAGVYGNIESFKLQVFDRWGNLVFQTSNPGNGWNGKMNGIDAPAGVFIWQCSYRLQGEENIFQRGIVTLIR